MADLCEVVASRTRVRDIIKAVAIVADMTTGEVLSGCRRRPYVLARWAVMRIASSRGRSTIEIGRVMRLDHTTVVHGLYMLRTCHDRNPEFIDRVNEIVAGAEDILARQAAALAIQINSGRCQAARACEAADKGDMRA